ncbi:MAG TPA: DUF4058 family protein [Anaerolineae bacterium]|nr:DUF4058 family protein [Anaerolineae bacterium]
MPSPFPGMDPYLEHPALWPDVRSRLIVALSDFLGPILRPRYYVAVEERTYVLEVPNDMLLAARPDVSVIERQRPASAVEVAQAASSATPITVELPLPEEVRETYLEIREPASGKVVAVIELLSPTNKQPGTGRRLYEEKRLLMAISTTHLVEIDLLRAGEPMTVRGDGRKAHYRILVSRANRRPLADLYAFNVRDPIPVFSLPLQPGDEEPLVDLGALLQLLYDRAGYDLRIDYRQEPAPPLEGDDAAWADALLRQAGLRP